MKQNGVLATIVVFFFLLVFIAPLGVRPLFTPDETRYAEIPREMRAQNDWIVPRLVGLRYFEKTPMGYWMTATSLSLFGENRFAVRLPAALAAGLSALIVGLLVRRATGAGHAGALTGFCHLTLLLVAALGGFNVLDGPFACLVTASMAFAFLASETPAPGKRRLHLAVFGACVGMAFLTKGLLAFAIPGLTFGAFLIWQRRWRDLLVMPWIPIAVAAIVILPWAILIHRREPDFWHYFFWVEHVQRFTNPAVGQHDEPFWALIPYLIGGAIPWVFMGPAAWPALRERIREKSALVRFSIGWLVLPFLLVSASEGKLGTYVLPCFAPLAILLGLGLSGDGSPATERRLRIGCYAGAVLAACVTAFLAAARWIPGSLRTFDAGENGIWLLAVCAGLVWVGLTYVAVRLSGIGRLLVFGAAPMAILLAFQLATPMRFLRYRAPEAFLAKQAQTVTPRVDIWTTSYIAPAVAWSYKRTNIGIAFGEGELKYGLNTNRYPNAAGRLLTLEAFQSILSHAQRKHDIALILSTRDGDRRLSEQLPPPARSAALDGFQMLYYGRF